MRTVPVMRPSARMKAVQAEVATHLGSWTDAEKEEHFGRGYAPYWLSFPVDTLVRQAELVRRAERDKQPLAIEHRVQPDRSVTEITIYTLDTHGLFARLAGAMRRRLTRICTSRSGSVISPTIRGRVAASSSGGGGTAGTSGTLAARTPRLAR